MSLLTDHNIPNFSSFQEWMDYIHDSGYETDDDSTTTKPPRFLERPLDNWIVNLTAILEPCDRLIHTSAHCLDYLTREHEYLIPAQPSLSSSEEMNFHIFWRGPITDKVYLSALSFLFTQPLHRSKLHIWIDSADLPDGIPEDYTKNEYAAPLVSELLSRFIKIHAWDQAAEVEYSYGKNKRNDLLKDLEVQVKESNEPAKPVALSDEARFLILNRNGGIYLDVDVLLLKDMSPFYDSGLEFAYEWSSTRQYNTAILRLFPGSSVARRILDGARAREAKILNGKAIEKLAELEKLESEAEKDTEGEAGRVIEEGEEVGEEVSEEEGQKDNEIQVDGQPDVRFVHQSRIRHKEVSILKLSKRREMRPEEIYHPARLREYLRPQDSMIEGNGLIMMPTAVFDPLWLRIDDKETKESKDTEMMVEDLRSFPDAFSDPEAVCPSQSTLSQETTFAAGPETFVTGAYAYHWHNSWSTPIEPKSWMGLMLKAYEDFVEGQRPNIYGEWFEDAL
ncbi:hypothetical protein BGZ46_001642 [Entomortierella lignicola]|nr:hypothetical protein BGZ46_001642 [Entomortierella lignicola]